ncbi:gibberellin 20 oxidase 3-like [Telopea speciosissima]|uniref:gibberellin 20 oxidase 3-like n=1 Tax=Telopea speciosissima TaxID=54955 RepID=UPI001CC55EC1|nr:gibberellin 20 oxidase 3-like [Telopea speciosissima]
MSVDFVSNVPVESVVFDASVLQHETNISNIPKEFIWPDDDKFSGEARELPVPIIDMGGFLSGDPVAVMEACKQVREACEKHGFFVIINHGIDDKQVDAVHMHLKRFFEMPLSEKKKARREFGDYIGYASSFTERFTTRLPWKETFSLHHVAESNSVEEYLVNVFGDKEFGRVFQEFSNSMGSLGLEIMELLGESLGVGSYFKKFYENHDSVLRLNYYPKCQTPQHTIGTGPHADPISITILHQDDVSGLQVLMDDEWFNVSPYPGSFVINVGDTFMALTNGRYKSVVHRAVVNNEKPRVSLAYFMNPQPDKILRPPSELVDEEKNPRNYPDFSWGALHEFTQKEHRVGTDTLDWFFEWKKGLKTY